MARVLGTLAQREKPFREALRMVVAEAGDNPRKLRHIAEKLYDKALGGDVQAICAIADRLDGKPAQEQVISKSPLGELTDDELFELLHLLRTAAARAAAGGAGGAEEVEPQPARQLPSVQ